MGERPFSPVHSARKLKDTTELGWISRGRRSVLFGRLGRGVIVELEDDPSVRRSAESD